MKVTLFEGILETYLKNWKIKNNELQQRQNNKIYVFLKAISKSTFFNN